MKTLFVTALLLAEVLGSPLVARLVRLRSRRNKCAAAEDLVCPRSDITFWLYTRSTQFNPTELDINALDQAPWVDAPLKFIVHGYSVDKDTAINAILRPAYFSNGEFNIISVDWSALGRQGCYGQAVQNVPTVAKCVADFFNAVTEARQFRDVHLLGHSMGAHVAAWASTSIPNLPRLTKFDVAHPLFNSKNTNNGTAGFIDVYHSNCGLKGQKRPSGDVDVYFNNRAFQPGCKCDTACSHNRAVEYYAGSIGATNMRAFACHSWMDYLDGNCGLPTAEDLVIVGENADTKLRGTYMAFTNPEPPFLLDDFYYTDEGNFTIFKRKLPGECTVAYDYIKLISDWF